MTSTSVKNNNLLPPGLVSNLQQVLSKKNGDNNNNNKNNDDDNVSNSEAESKESDNVEPAEPSSSTSVSDASETVDTSKPIVLVTNGDGVDSPGLVFLVEALVREGLYNVHVCAPQSWVQSPSTLLSYFDVFCVWLFVSSGFLIWVCGVFHWFLINFDIWLSGLLSFPEFYKVYFVVYCLFPLIFSSGCGFFDCLVVDFVCFFFFFGIDFDIWLCGLLSFPVLYRLYFVVYCLFPLIFSSGLCGFYCFWLLSCKVLCFLIDFDIWLCGLVSFPILVCEFHSLLVGFPGCLWL